MASAAAPAVREASLPHDALSGEEEHRAGGRGEGPVAEWRASVAAAPAGGPMATAAAQLPSAREVSQALDVAVGELAREHDQLRVLSARVSARGLVHPSWPGLQRAMEHVEALSLLVRHTGERGEAEAARLGSALADTSAQLRASEARAGAAEAMREKVEGELGRMTGLADGYRTEAEGNAKELAVQREERARLEARLEVRDEKLAEAAEKLAAAEAATREAQREAREAQAEASRLADKIEWMSKAEAERLERERRERAERDDEYERRLEDRVRLAEELARERDEAEMSLGETRRDLRNKISEAEALRKALEAAQANVLQLRDQRADLKVEVLKAQGELKVERTRQKVEELERQAAVKGIMAERWKEEYSAKDGELRSLQSLREKELAAEYLESEQREKYREGMLADLRASNRRLVLYGEEAGASGKGLADQLAREKKAAALREELLADLQRQNTRLVMERQARDVHGGTPRLPALENTAAAAQSKRRARTILLGADPRIR